MGKEWPPELPPLSGFLLFFVTCHAMQCHALSRNMYIFNPGGLQCAKKVGSDSLGLVVLLSGQ